MTMTVTASCSVASCDRPSKTRGMCGAHAERVRKGISLAHPIREPRNFDDQFIKQDGCWTWRGPVSTSGYGRFGKLYAHRISYERAVGPIPDGLHIDHLCRNTLCVNPAHLEAVPPRINMLRGMAPGARAIRTNHCKRGHEFTPENTYVRHDNGYRQCRKCHALAESSRQRRLREAS